MKYIVVASIFIITIIGTQDTHAQYLYLDHDSTINSPTTFDSVRIVAGGILTANDSITVLGNMTIDPGGQVTNTQGDTGGLWLDITDTLKVNSDGVINVTVKGLPGGQAYDSTGSYIITGATSNAGGSYGGYAALATTNKPYGVAEDPRHCGSGGAWGCFSGASGGGLVRIKAGTVILNGTIEANGANGDACVYYGGGGGGSGGGINIHCGRLEGIGLITASGGNGGNRNQSGGSGGRIAVYYTSMDFPFGNIRAYGGASWIPSAAGTIYLRDTVQVYRDLIIDNGGISSSAITPCMVADTNLHIMKIKSRGRFVVGGTQNLFIENQIVTQDFAEMWVQGNVVLTVQSTSAYGFDVQSGSSVTLGNNSTVNNDRVRITGGGTFNSYIDLEFLNPTNLEVSTSGNLYFFNGATLTVSEFDTVSFKSGSIYVDTLSYINIQSNRLTIGNGVSLYKDGLFSPTDTIESIHILAGGKVGHSGYTVNGGQGLWLHITDTLKIDSGGVISVTGQGLLGGQSYDSTGSYVITGATSDAGGSYGGYAALATTNKPYGVAEDPRHCGSGGAWGCFSGASGGGLVRINAGTVILNGTIEANGANGDACVYYGGGGGGSGGGINIHCGRLEGIGLITASGGNGGNRNQSGGSGGRIAVYYTSMDFPFGNIRAYGGASWIPSAAGTTFLKDNTQIYGNLFVNDIIYSGMATPIASNRDTIYNITASANSILKSQSNIAVLNQFDLRNKLYLRRVDTLFIERNDSLALIGGGLIDSGTIRRAIQPGSISLYRFESEQSYVRFNDTGTYPSHVAMTVYPKTKPSDYGELWEIVPSVVDPISNTITADTVKKFSKWRMGIPRAQSIIPIVERRYNIEIEGGEDFSATLVLRYDQSEVPVEVKEDSLLLLRGLPVTLAFDVSPGWNIISLPVEVEDARRVTLFPYAASEAYYYDGAYFEEDTLKKGISYWLKFHEIQTICYNGVPSLSEVITVKEGWNLIGTICEIILVSAIESDPPGIVTSNFFEYKGSYLISDTIYPGKGYWVKVNQPGLLMMSSSESKNKINKIRIVPTSELPPPPPDNVGSKPDEIPTEYGLEQAYPSPFNPTTTIKYKLPVDSKVTLKVHNVLGQVVFVLIDEYQTAGYKSVIWNAKDLASGIYFYRLDAVSNDDPKNSFTEVKKITFIK